MVDNASVNLVDPNGLSPFSILAKQIAKQGIKKGMREFAEKQVTKRLSKYMNKKAAKEFREELEGILDTLDSEWWELCIEFIPAVGDLYGGGKLALKVRDAYKKIQDLENKFVGKISDSLSGDVRKQLMDRTRKKNVKDARRDSDALDNITGSTNPHKGLDGAHGDSVSTTPSRAGDPRNIEFKSRDDHFQDHGNNWRTPTTSSGDIYRN